MHLLSQVGSSAVTFSDLVPGEQYFATVSRVAKDSFPSVPTVHMSPRAEAIIDAEMENETTGPGKFLDLFC